MKVRILRHSQTCLIKSFLSFYHQFFNILLHYSVRENRIVFRLYKLKNIYYVINNIKSFFRIGAYVRLIDHLLSN